MARAPSGIPFRRRVLAVLGLFFLAPISAEYLLGYDDIIGRPWELVFGLLIFGPLYGAPALLIREAARRSGRGWPTILTLSFAAGLIQAGLIDQSLFNPDYRDIPYWADLREPTYLPRLGFSAYMLLGFVGGHMIQSFAAPIAIVESLAPDLGRRPWLRWPGLVIVTLLYAAAAYFVLADQAKTEGFVASGPQLIGSALVVVALVIAAFAAPSRPRIAPGHPPTPLVVGLVVVTGLAIRSLMPTTWPGVLVNIAVLVLLGILVWRWSARSGWGAHHVLAVAAAPLLVNAAMAFWTEPLGDPRPVVKYAVNAALATGVILLLLAAARSIRKRPKDRPEAISSTRTSA